jgi:hypothetical protein
MRRRSSTAETEKDADSLDPDTISTGLSRLTGDLVQQRPNRCCLRRRSRCGTSLRNAAGEARPNYRPPGPNCSGTVRFPPQAAYRVAPPTGSSRRKADSRRPASMRICWRLGPPGHRQAVLETATGRPLWKFAPSCLVETAEEGRAGAPSAQGGLRQKSDHSPLA